MHTRTCLALAATVTTGALLFGCANVNTTSNTTLSTSHGTAASAVQHPFLENIPLPQGFRLVPERSVARESGRYRMAKCEFEGAVAPEQVTAFYQNYMPSAQFRLKTRNLEAGEYRLRFESGTEECNIRVSRHRGTTVLVVDLGPLPQGTAERQRKPLTSQR